MSAIELQDERILKVADILEQVQSVDEMIHLHRKKGDANDIMLLQYEYRRSNFLKELGIVLQGLSIMPRDLAA